MRSYNQVQMKTYEQLLPKFSNEPGLIYRDMFVYPNNSIYRGQMKKRDEATKMKISNGDNGSNGGPNQGNADGTMDDDPNIQEFRHGYGIQYWTDGAHYEG